MTQSVVVIDPSDGSEIDYTANYRPDKGMEIGGEAFNGETDSGGTIVFDDTAGAIVNRDDLAHGRRIIIREDASGSDIPIHMGRISPRSQYRDVEVADRARSITITTRDQNADLSGIIVDGWSRPAEEPFERIQALLAAYLNGSSSTELNPDGEPWGRASTVIGDGFVNTTPLGTDMPAKDYVETDPREVVRDCCEWAGYDAFVILNDDETLDLFFDDRTGTAYTSTLSISDNDAQVDDTLCFAPIWDLGPAHELDGSEQATGLLLVGGDESRTYDNRPAVEVVNDKWEYVDRSEATEQADLNNNLVALLNARQEEELRIQFSMLVPADSIHLLRPGMRMEVKRAYAAGIGTPTYFRAVQVRYRWVSHEYYMVGVYLGFPVKLVRRYGEGRTVPTPPTGGGTASCATPIAQMTQIATPNGGFELGDDTNWNLAGLSANVVGPGAGAWEGDYFAEINGGGSASYVGPLATTPVTAGEVIVIKMKVADAGISTFLRATNPALGADYADVTAVTGTDFDDVCLEWTVASDLPGFAVTVAVDSSLDDFSVDDLRVYRAGSGDTTEPVGEEGSGSSGTPGTYAPLTHVHEHGNLSGDFEYHDADQVSIDDAGGYFTGTDVEAALQELGATGGPHDHDADYADIVHTHGSPAAGFHGVLVQRTTDFVAANSNDANPEFDTEHYDTDGLWDVSAPKILGPLPASYDGKMIRLGAWVGFQTTTTGMCETKIYRNVTPGSISTTNDDKLVPGGVAQHTPNNFNTFIAHLTAAFPAAEGDTFTIAIKSGNGANALDYHSVSILFGLEVVEPGEGAQGDPGQGVPAGGTLGQVLAKASGTDYDTEWVDAATDPANDTQAWMPLTTVVGGVPELVWDANNSLIPTLVPLE